MDVLVQELALCQQHGAERVLPCQAKQQDCTKHPAHRLGCMLCWVTHLPQHPDSLQGLGPWSCLTTSENISVSIFLVPLSITRKCPATCFAFGTAGKTWICGHEVS